MIQQKRWRKTKLKKLEARLAVLEAQPDEAEEIKKEEAAHEEWKKKYPENKDDYFWHGAYKKILVHIFE